MNGREVRAPWDGVGVVVKWEPLSSGMCDTLVRFEGGREVWHASHTLRPVGLLAGIPLPNRAEARAEADRRTLAQLQAIRGRLVDEWHRPWPGAEHGKALVGKGIDGAIEKVRQRCTRVPV